MFLPSRVLLTGLRLMLSSLLLTLPAACERQPEGSDTSAELVRTIGWADLLPAGEADRIAALREGRADSTLMSQFVTARREDQIGTFNVVESLDGQRIRMPGFLLPVEFAERGSAREFLLLPFHGACVHYPPPPPNQIVHILTDPPVPFDGLWDPVWIEGVLRIERTSTELAEAAYALDLISVTPYQS